MSRGGFKKTTNGGSLSFSRNNNIGTNPGILFHGENSFSNFQNYVYLIFYFFAALWLN